METVKYAPPTERVVLDMSAAPEHIPESEAVMRRWHGRNWRCKLYPGAAILTCGLTAFAVYFGESRNSLKDGLLMGMFPFGIVYTVVLLEIFTRCCDQRPRNCCG